MRKKGIVDFNTFNALFSIQCVKTRSESSFSLFSFIFVRTFFFVRLCPAVYLYRLDVCRSSNAQAEEEEEEEKKGEREREREEEENTHTDIIRYLIYHYDYFLLSARFLIVERKEERKRCARFILINAFVDFSLKKIISFRLIHCITITKYIFLPFRSSSSSSSSSL